MQSKKRSILLFCCCVLNIVLVSAQEKDATIQSGDSIKYTRYQPRTEKKTQTGDTLAVLNADQLRKELKVVNEFQPDPHKALIYSVIFPGLGQIYNKKYWKLPIIYGGFLGVVYAVSWNGNMHSDYRNAYVDIITDPEGRTSWHNFVANPQDVLNNPNLLGQKAEYLKRRRDYFRRNRDLAIIVGVGLYALSIVDAYVDASLYNFSISPDLSMTVAPAVWGPSNTSGNIAFGMQCNITF